MSHPNNPTTASGDHADWAPCEEGRLAGLASRLRSDHTRRVRRQSAVIAASSAAGAVALMATILAVWPESEAAPVEGKLACAECRDRFPEYVAFLTADLARTTERVQQTIDHLAECPACKTVFANEYPGLKAVAASYGFTTLAAVAAIAGTRRWPIRRGVPRG
ncbi:MAG: hypothetical protein AAF805_15005 [Planctomycetota bacterium]